MSLKTFSNKPTRSVIAILGGFLASVALISGLFIYINNHPTHAADTANFDPGNIISDSVFFDPSTMTAGTIQSFLNSKVTSCDTNGTQIYSGTTTRAAYSASKGYNAPFTCLKDYSTTTSQEPVDAYCNGYSAATQTAAQIIYGVAQSCGINPQVLIVLLQKEQGLVTDTWPWTSQYQKATGYACPDTAACDTTYYGLFNQLYYAARQYKIYQANPSAYSYRAGRNNNILWNPNSACSSNTVYIQNQATAGLYNYTPYQPDAAALAAGYGTGDACSSYGNRNFWLYFTDWFGSTQGLIAQTDAVWRLYQPSSGDHLLTASAITATRYMSNGWTNDGVVMHTALSGGTPVYQLWNGNAHFYTASTAEMNDYLNAGWSSDGIAFYTPASGTPVYRLWNGRMHFYTDNVQEVLAYQNSGWSNDGIAFYEPTTQIDPIWRLYNPSTNDHYYTNQVSVMNTYFMSGWVNDGIVMQGSGQSGTPVYQLWNGKTHFYTTSLSTKSTYMASGWKDDGIAFNTASAGTSVYQLWSGGAHFYTSDPSEIKAYMAAGWSSDGVAFTVANVVNVHRLYNASNGGHILISNTTQLWQYLASGWTDDGTLFNASSSYGTALYQLYNPSTGSHFYTTNASERTTYVSAGWTNDGAIAYVPTQGNPFYRLYNSTTQQHTIVSAQELSNYVSAGWISDGIIFYGS